MRLHFIYYFLFRGDGRVISISQYFMHLFTILYSLAVVHKKLQKISQVNIYYIMCR